MDLPLCICFLLAVHFTDAFLSGSASRELIMHETPRGRGRGKLGPSNTRLEYCPKSTVTDCESINSTRMVHTGKPLELKCFNTTLPYSNISLDLLPEVTSLTEMLEIVESWQVLRNIPKCWAVVQPLICAFHLPQCKNREMHLPSHEMCLLALGHCKLLGQYDDGFPAFLNCNDTTMFPPDCKNDVLDLRFNTSASCPFPLVPVTPRTGISVSTDPQKHYPGLEGCSLPCDTPLFSPEELTQLRSLVAYAGTAALLLNLFVVATFIVDWGSSARYPALIIFYMNLCSMCSTSGWLLQFIPGARTDILCRRDGTAREQEPSAGENLSCVMVFVVVYYFLMAALVWFVILTYSWNIMFRSLGRVKENIDSKSAYFHLAAWSLPLVLTTTTLALGEVHADSSAGVCFVGTAGGSTTSVTARTFLLLAPVLVAFFTGGFYLTRGLVTLVNIRINSLDLVSQRASHRIKNTLVRITVFSLGVLGLCLLTIACHIYEYRHAESWHKALDNYVICNALGLSSPCLLSSHPSLSAVQLHLLAPFVFSALCASWLINSNSRATWIRVLGRRCPCCVAPPMPPNPRSLSHMASTEDGEVLERGATKGLTIQKRKVIARAFAKRKLLHKEGRLSICFGSSHGDPVGMAFDVDSAASTGGFSSAWAAAIPRLVSRRNALTVNGSVSSVRRNSIDSSFSMRSVSIESRRNSTDSQISLQISEFTAHHQTRSSRRSRSCHKHASRHRSRRHSRNTRVRPPCSRQASVSSLDSGPLQILQALQMAGPSGLTTAALSLAPNPQQLGARRAANAGIEGPSPTLLARLRLPGYSSHSDVEAEQIEMLALSRTSVSSKIEQEPTADVSTHNGVEINSCDDSDTSSSSSTSSFSPELSVLTSHNSGVPTKTSPSAHHTSPKLNNHDDDDSSSSPDEDAPFLPTVSNSKEFKRKSPSQASKASSCGPHKETREIGVQASLDLEEGLGVRKSGRRKKGLNNSYNAHRLVSELAAHQSSRSKSAGHC